MENSIVLVDVRQKFETVCQSAKSLQIANNFGTAFEAVQIVLTLREILTDDVMKEVFMPLMNTKVGFLTDRTGKPDKHGNVKEPYSISVVRDVIIDAVTIGLLPTGNQFNIIAERMYPTKEGYTALLKKIGVKYILDVSYDKGTNANFAEIPVKINYEHDGEKNSFTPIATVKKDSFSSHDQLRGKAERNAKKKLYEYITGCDFGDADEMSGIVDTPFVDVTHEPQLQKLNFKTEAEARIFFVTDQGFTPESVEGKLLFSLAKEKGFDLIIAGISSAKLSEAEQKKTDLKGKANQSPTLM
ncbi:MAG: hypothetical protein LLF95_11345 [Bacteroidales bacterium]|nr:hypothetical protein [Bacteroidales bacterium]